MILENYSVSLLLCEIIEIWIKNFNRDRNCIDSLNLREWVVG